MIASSVCGGELHNYSHTWKSWTDYERHVYLWGYGEGSEAGGLKVMGAYVNAKKVFNLINNGDDFPGLVDAEPVRQAILPFGPNVVINVIQDVITDLYKDPANAYITFSSMVEIARKELKGEKVEEDIRDARGYQERAKQVLQEMENK